MKRFFTYCSLCLLLFSCHRSTKETTEEVAEPETPVTVTSITNEPMEDYVELNATSTYLQKWVVKSTLNGYLQSANVQLNKYVGRGQTLYTVKTKEAKSIGNTINILDSSFKFTGTNRIAAVASGFISQIDHQNGDYVQDGEQLAVITDMKSFVFLLDMPYELRPFILNKKTVEMILPDGEKLLGTISGNMPGMDSASQTQRVILKVNAAHPIPENLIAKVKVVKSAKTNAFSLPKAAILTDETQAEFWVMKLLNDSTAVKVSVKKGIETQERIEIVSPPFAAGDRFLISGNYGLGDTAKVKVITPEKKE
jgi:multidrug efflux pump subunit AcrA (membrane-fusion protein)